MAEPLVKSKIPYLTDAIRFWATDSGMTPQLLVNVRHPSVKLPFHLLKQKADKELILNVHERAVVGFRYEEEYVLFETRFSGQSFQVSIPFGALIAIFTRETQEGFYLLGLAHEEDSKEATAAESEQKFIRGKPNLTLVK